MLMVDALYFFCFALSKSVQFIALSLSLKHKSPNTISLLLSYRNVMNIFPRHLDLVVKNEESLVTISRPMELNHVHVLHYLLVEIETQPMIFL